MLSNREARSNFTTSINIFRPHGPTRTHLRLPGLRRRLRALARQMRRLRRLEHGRRRERAAHGRRCRGRDRARAQRSAPRGGRFSSRRCKARPRRRRARVSGIAEFDRVTGGGFVRGSVLLVGGDPGIGKSTLLIQASAALARAGGRVVYISGRGGDRAGAASRRAAKPCRLVRGARRARPMSRTSSRRSRAGPRRSSSSSIRSRRCGPRLSNWRRER